MEDQDRQRLATVEQGLGAITARLNALAEGHLELPGEGFRVGSTRLLEKLVSDAYHLHQRDGAGVESDLTGAKSIWGIPIVSTTPTAAQVLKYNASTEQWELASSVTPAAHKLADTSGLGPEHTTTGLTARQVLRATGATTAAFGAIQDADLPATIARDSELHTRLHALTDVLDHSATNWRLFYSDGSGHVIELALGADGTFLQSGGASTLPEFTALIAGDIPDISATYVAKALFDAGTFLYAVSDNTPIVKTRAEVMALLSGQATADFSMNTHKITAVVDPTSAQHAATKKYVDDHNIRTITFVIDGGGSAITTGIKGDLEIPFACTITQVTLLADQSGSIVIDIWKDTYANFPPIDGDSITASAPPTISGATKSQDSTLSGWTTAITAGNILRFNVDSVATIERVTLSLKVTVP